MAKARARADLPTFIGRVEAYCGHCPVRRVWLEVKEHDERTAADLCCPACRHPLTLHHVETRDEWHGADEAAARSSVIEQLYERRHPGESVPLGVFLNVSLDDLIARVVADEAST